MATAEATAMMMTRPIVIALIGSLIGAPPALADRHSRRTKASKKKIEKVDRSEKEKVEKIEKTDADDEPVDDRRRAGGDDDDAPAARREAARRAVAQAPGARDDDDDDDSDGPEATGAVQVTLDELIEVTVRLAPELARSKTDQKNAKGQAIGIRKGWHVEAEAKYDKTGTGGDVAVEPLQVVNEDKLSGTLSASRKLGSGGAVMVQGGYVRTHKEFAISADLLHLLDVSTDPAVNMELQKQLPDGSPVEDTTGYTTFAKVTFNQPLIKGAGSVAKTEGKKLELASNEATVRVQLTAEKMLREIITDYWELAYAAQEVDINAAALAIAKEQDRITRTEARAGKVADTEINAITFEIAQRTEALLASQNEYEKKSLALRDKVGLGLERRDVVMRPAEPFEIGKEEWDIEDVRARAHKLNRGLAVIALQRRAADYDVKKAKNDMLPGLDLELSAGVNGLGNTPDEALSGAPSANGFTVTAGLKLSFDLGPAARGNYDAARARYQKVEIERIEAERQIDTAIVSAVHTVTSARARVGLADEAIRVATLNAKAELSNFQMGRSNNFTVMQRQTDLTNARKRRARAVTEYHIAVAQLQALSGTLLAQYDINIRPKMER
jgi:outer membrane protein TolC